MWVAQPAGCAMWETEKGAKRCGRAVDGKDASLLKQADASADTSVAFLDWPPTNQLNLTLMLRIKDSPRIRCVHYHTTRCIRGFRLTGVESSHRLRPAFETGLTKRNQRTRDEMNGAQGRVLDT